MKLIMTLLVRDEEDIIRENIEFHKQQGVDFFIVTDNGSVDNTPTILKTYEKEGILKYKHESSNYNQSKWVTNMAQDAYTNYGADWVINNDADEFWFSKNNSSLKETFKTIDKQYNVVIANRHNFIPIQNTKEKPFYETMVYKETHSKNPIGDPLPPKAAHRGDANIKVSPGNHNVSGFEQKNIIRDCLEIFHFPMRSENQYERKMINLGSGYLCSNRENLRKDLYMKYLKNPSFFKEKYHHETYSKCQVLKKLYAKTLQKDTRLRNTLLNIR